MKRWKLKQVLFPPRCVLCRDYLNPDVSILFCQNCLKELPNIPSVFCPVCGRVTPAGNALCFQCHIKKPHFRKHRSIVFYTKAIRGALLQFKFYRKRHYAIPLGALMSSYVNEDYDLITAVPITKAKSKIRGYNQSRLLAEQIERLRGIPYIDTLKKIKNTPPQSRLPGKKRFLNLKNAFAVIDKRQVSGKKILLIDDIYTTGTTVNECARMLKKAGASYVDVLTFAMADKRIKQIEGTLK